MDLFISLNMKITMILFILIIKVEHYGTEAQRFGELSVVTPTFVNRDMTFHILTNITTLSENLDVIKWKVQYMQRTEFHDIRSIFATEYKHYEKRDGVWMDVKRVNKSLDKALVYAEYNKSVSNTIVVSLQEFDNECGHLSVFEFPKKIGDTARIAYYPTQDILDREQDFHRAWRTALGVIKLKRGAFEEKDVSLNRHFILSIFNITERTEYSLECKRTRSLPRTKSVSVFVGNPVLGPLCSLDGCVNCVCVNPGESVYCKSSSDDVQIRVGNNSLPFHRLSQRNEIVYTTNGVNSAWHMQTITCYAGFHDNGERFFKTNRSLYFIVPPAELYLNIPKKRFGELVNITCTAKSGRPPSKLQLTINSEIADDAEQIDFLNDSSHLYTSRLVKQLHLDRRLSNTAVNCTSIATTNNQKHTQVNSTSQILSYAYPPSRLNMTRPPNPDHVASWYQFHIGCKAYDSTDDCRIEWSSDKNCFDIHNTTKSKQLYDIDSWIYVNVSPNTTECMISCHVVCHEYNVSMKEDFIVEITAFTSGGISSLTPSGDKDTGNIVDESSFPIRFAWIGSLAASVVVVIIATVVITVKVVLYSISRKRQKASQPKTQEIQQNEIPPAACRGQWVDGDPINDNARQFQMAYPQIEEQGATGSDIVYADLDIDFLEKCRAFATKPDCYEPTEYADVATTLEMIEEPDYINVGEFSYDHLQ